VTATWPWFNRGEERQARCYPIGSGLLPEMTSDRFHASRTRIVTAVAAPPLLHRSRMIARLSWKVSSATQPLIAVVAGCLALTACGGVSEPSTEIARVETRAAIGVVSVHLRR